MPRILGIDFGTRRIGLAISDPTGNISTSLPTLTRRAGKRAPVAAITALAIEHRVGHIVIGLPSNRPDVIACGEVPDEAPTTEDDQ